MALALLGHMADAQSSSGSIGSPRKAARSFHDLSSVLRALVGSRFACGLSDGIAIGILKNIDKRGRISSGVG